MKACDCGGRGWSPGPQAQDAWSPRGWEGRRSPWSLQREPSPALRHPDLRPPAPKTLRLNSSRPEEGCAKAARERARPQVPRGQPRPATGGRGLTALQARGRGAAPGRGARPASWPNPHRSRRAMCTGACGDRAGGKVGGGGRWGHPGNRQHRPWVPHGHSAKDSVVEAESRKVLDEDEWMLPT